MAVVVLEINKKFSPKLIFIIINFKQIKLSKSATLFFTVAALAISLSACAQTRTGFDSANVQGVKQDSNFKQLRFIPGSFTLMDVDVLDNIYLITEGNQLKKIKANGDSAAVYNDVKQYGNPSILDVTNPLKVLVYYKNYSTVVVLDRFLTFRNSINFRKENIFRIKALTTSYDNNIWIFDEQDLTLKKIDDDGKVLGKTSDFRQIFDETPQPAQIIDRDDAVYLYDPAKGFYIFDYYGSFKSELPFLNWQHVSIAGGKILGFINDTLYSYEVNSLILKSYKLPAFFSNYTDIKAMNGKLYLLKKDGVDVYNIL